MAELNEKQKRFCHEYVIDLNGTRAYRKAYNTKTDNTAKINASRLLTKANIKAYIKKLTEKHDKPSIATADEVLEFLSNTVRGITTADQTPDYKDRIKAAELIGKRHALFTDKVEHAGELTITFEDDYGE